MDPLSLTTSVLALLGACGTASRTFAKIRRLRDAPALIQAINNEVADLHLVITDINEFFEDAQECGRHISSPEGKPLELYSSTLDQTRKKILAVEHVIAYRLLKPGREADLKIDRSVFLREESNLVRLRSELQDCRQRMIGLFSHLGIRKLANIETRLDAICSDYLQNISQSQTRIESALGQVLSIQLLGSNTGRRPHSGVLPNSSLSSVELSVSRSRSSVEAAKCACRREKTSIYAQTFLGTLFACYSATPTVRRRDCPYHADRDLFVHYLFPTWFLQHMLCFQMKWNPGRNITYSLTITQTIPHEHVIYDMIVVEDIEGIRQLLLSEKLSIEAQSSSLVSGSLLWSAIVAGKIESIKLFIDMGANIYLDYSPQFSPLRVAWDMILSKTHSAEWREQMRALLPPDPDFDELYGFSPIHKAVLGLSTRSVASVIDADPSRINTQDRTGRTPLTWAVWRGDYESTHILLSHKPDLDVADDFGRVPLVYAARRSWQCAKLLLEANADVKTKDKYQGTLLHHAAFRASSGDIEIVHHLVSAGVNIDAVDDYNQTALIKTNKFEVAEYLICQGANPRFRDSTGNNALSYAVQLNNHALIYLFLQNRHDHTEEIKHYGTLMHLAAEFSDERTIRMLASGRLQRRNISVENGKCLTPIEVAVQRRDADVLWRDAFWSFLKSIDENLLFDGEIEPLMDPRTEDQRHANEFVNHLVELLGSDEEFVEAPEYQELPAT